MEFIIPVIFFAAGVAFNHLCRLIAWLFKAAYKLTQDDELLAGYNGYVKFKGVLK